MLKDEFYNATRIIDRLLGSQSSWLIADMNTEERMKIRGVWDNLAEQLLIVAEKYPSEAGETTCFSDRFSVGGITPMRYPWAYYRAANTLYVNDKQVLICAPLPQILEYILTH